MIDIESLESIFGTIGDEAGKVVDIVTTNKFSKARRLINQTSPAPYGMDERKWRKRERKMKSDLWLNITIIKRMVNSWFNGLVHIFRFITSGLH